MEYIGIDVHASEGKSARSPSRARSSSAESALARTGTGRFSAAVPVPGF
jgi:hypothetical protein